jgi:NADH-quinone oxidoreductase subunit N
MFFKIAAVPFHFGRLMFMKGPHFDHCLNEHIGKVVAIATLFKLLTIMNADISPAFQLIIVIISMASMTVGNIMALRQVNVKRILAFSGISHAGFMLMTLLNTTNTAGTLLYYTSAYARIAAFSVIIYVCKDNENEDMVNFHGLGKLIRY